MQDLVVLGHGDAEDDGRHVLEAVDPLLALRSLASDVEKPETKKVGAVIFWRRDSSCSNAD